MFRRYLWLLATVSGVTFLSVALFNLAIDPYDHFGMITIEGLNSVKPRPEANLREVKRDLWSSRTYDALILGNSRAEVGFDPANSALIQAGFSTFNMALPGTDLRDALGNLAFVNARRPPRLLIVGVEFLDFLVDPNPAPDTPSSLQRKLGSIASPGRFDHFSPFGQRPTPFGRFSRSAIPTLRSCRRTGSIPCTTTSRSLEATDTGLSFNNELSRMPPRMSGSQGR